MVQTLKSLKLLNNHILRNLKILFIVKRMIRLAKNKLIYSHTNICHRPNLYNKIL